MRKDFVSRRHELPRALSIVVALGCMGCETVADRCHPTTDGCPQPYLGSACDDVQLQVTALDSSFVGDLVRDGDSIAVLSSPASSWSMWVSAVATNLSPCGVHVGVQLRDPMTDETFAVGATVIDLVAGPDGWGRPSNDLGGYAFVPMCPNYNPFAVVGLGWDLEIAAQDADGRQVARRVQVFPECDRDDRSGCECACDPGYAPGKCG
jgi:hypothetical protein